MDLYIRGGGGGSPYAANHSSPTSLSSPPSSPALSARLQSQERSNFESLDETDDASRVNFGNAPASQDTSSAAAVAKPKAKRGPLTNAGVPRKKPGRKPGSHLLPKQPLTDASTSTPTAAEPPPKTRKPRKPKDPNAAPPPRKRQVLGALENQDGEDTRMSDIGTMDAKSALTDYQIQLLQVTAEKKAQIIAENQARIALSQPPAPPGDINDYQNESRKLQSNAKERPVAARTSAPSRDPKTAGSMMNILNQESVSPYQAYVPAPRKSGLAFDPVRAASYDPVRESMAKRDPYGTGHLISPQKPVQMPNRASASPSIASLVDPPVAMSPPPLVRPPVYQLTPTRPPDSSSALSSPQNTPQHSQTTTKNSTTAAPKSLPAMPVPPPTNAKSATTSKTVTTTNGHTASEKATASKKVTSTTASERKEKKKGSSTSSSPKMKGLQTIVPDLSGLPEPGNDRSILDFGKANPGQGCEVPSIVLTIPLVQGETNKYVNFMRMAEEQYGWDALHPRQVENRERKARIAAAASALERQALQKDDDEMSVNSQSDGDNDKDDDNDNSNVEMGGMGNDNGTSGPEGPKTAPAKGKRKLKEDDYDKDDDFVDDSEMLWEEQAAASRDGFFVYSGPLKQEVAEKAPGSDGPAKRGRGRGRGGGPGSRGGRVAADRANGDSATTTTGNRRGGGPGSRGGNVTRKPRITKLAKEQLEREKAEREKMAVLSSKSSNGAATAGSNGLGLAQPPPVGANAMVIDG